MPLSLEQVIGISIGLYIVGAIMPGALTSIATATLTSVDASVKTMFTVLLPIISVVAIVLLFLGYARGKI
jgi:hypothetical protein